jgi:hypothetical protein
MVFRFVALALIWLTALPALAQSDIVEASLVDSINESYDESAPVAGSPLVGLRLGEVSQRDGNNVLIAGPPVVGGGVCLRVTTRDGRFSASNFYQTPVDASALLVRVAPLAERYRNELDRYPADEVAFRAFASSSGTCSPGGAINLPIVDRHPVRAWQLVVFANGKSQSARALLYAGEVAAVEPSLPLIASADCTAAPGATIAYDLICTLPLPSGFAGRALLSVEFSDGFTTEHYDYQTLVPQLASR